MQNQRMKKDWIPLLGGFTALAGFFLPFDRCCSLFYILEHTPIPFFSPLLVLLLVLAMLLWERCPRAACLLGQGLLSGLLFLLCLLCWVFSPAVLLKGMGPGALLLLLGLLTMLLYPA